MAYSDRESALEDKVKYLEDRAERAEAEVERLRGVLTEISRPKRGGIEANDSDEEWLEYLLGALYRERAAARAALAGTPSGEASEQKPPSILPPEREFVWTNQAYTMRVAEAVREACFREWASMLGGDLLSEVDIAAVVKGVR